MNKPSRQAFYPQHHPHHGRPYIEVHDHDVLCGRGVNIAQHPGNERFRALVNNRQDEGYCTAFTTSEKRALAEEIVEHIRLLDPPGRFLKRTGRSHGSRGLSGPWEQLSHRECIKKTCQALRDCNRQDRQGYGAQVTTPNDVAESNEERAKSGLSLKEHAAAAAAKAPPSTLNPHRYHLNPPLSDQKAFGSPPSNDRKRAAVQLSRDDESTRLSPSVDLAAQWLKKQRNQEPHAMYCSNGPERGRLFEPEPSISSTSAAQVHSTPAPHIAPVPVTTTPASAPSYNASNGHPACHPYEDSLAVTNHTDSPQLPSPTTFHPEAMAPAPYSPVVLLCDHDDDHDDDPGADMEPNPINTNHQDHHHLHTQQFMDHHPHDDPHPFHTNLDHHGHAPVSDFLQSAAAMAASSMGHMTHHRRDNSLCLSNGDDDGTSLQLSDL